MKLSIERGALLKAVSQAQSVVERRNTIPILSNVLIQVEGDSVAVTATDLDITIRDRITGIDVGAAGLSLVFANHRAVFDVAGFRPRQYVRRVFDSRQGLEQ